MKKIIVFIICFLFSGLVFSESVFNCSNQVYPIKAWLSKKICYQLKFLKSPLYIINNKNYNKTTEDVLYALYENKVFKNLSSLNETEVFIGDNYNLMFLNEGDLKKKKNIFKNFKKLKSFLFYHELGHILQGPYKGDKNFIYYFREENISDVFSMLMLSKKYNKKELINNLQKFRKYEAFKFNNLIHYTNFSTENILKISAENIKKLSLEETFKLASSIVNKSFKEDLFKKKKAIMIKNIRNCDNNKFPIMNCEKWMSKAAWYNGLNRTKFRSGYLETSKDITNYKKELINKIKTDPKLTWNNYSQKDKYFIYDIIKNSP